MLIAIKNVARVSLFPFSNPITLSRPNASTFVPRMHFFRVTPENRTQRMRSSRKLPSTYTRNCQETYIMISYLVICMYFGAGKKTICLYLLRAGVSGVKQFVPLFNSRRREQE